MFLPLRNIFNARYSPPTIVIFSISFQEIAVYGLHKNYKCFLKVKPSGNILRLND